MDSEIRSSLHEIDHFIGSHVWEDALDELERLLEACRDDLEGAANWEEVCRAQGRCDAIRRMIKWPEVTRDRIEEEMEMTK